MAHGGNSGHNGGAHPHMHGGGEVHLGLLAFFLGFPTFGRFLCLFVLVWLLK